MMEQAFMDQATAAGGGVEFVFEDDRPFKECHASTIVETTEGDLVCAWFAGTREKDPDVGVWMSRFEGESWSAPVLAVKVAEKAHWNPVLFRDAEGVIYLFFKVGVNVPVWSTWWMQSEDHGITWSEGKELVPGDIGGRGPVKNKAIVLSDGSWLAPASLEYPGEEGLWEAFADRSTDRGKTWQRSAFWKIDRTKPPLDTKGAIQPSFWESEPGKVHALMRSTGGLVWRADSEDYGQTWAPVYATELPNNNSGLDALKLADGRVLLVYNPVKENWGPRVPLDLAVSSDNGVTWKTLAHLEDDEGVREEYSYPAIVATKDGIAISYTWKRQRVRVWRVPLSSL